MAHVIAVDAPPAALAGEPIPLVSAVFVLGFLSAALFTSARLVSERYTQWRLVLDSVGLAAVAYIAVLVFDGAMLVAGAGSPGGRAGRARATDRRPAGAWRVGLLPGRGRGSRAGPRGTTTGADLRRREPDRGERRACRLRTGRARLRGPAAGRQDLAGRALVWRSDLAAVPGLGGDRDVLPAGRRGDDRARPAGPPAGAGAGQRALGPRRVVRPPRGVCTATCASFGSERWRCCS